MAEKEKPNGKSEVAKTFKCPECGSEPDYVVIEYVARQNVQVADYIAGNYIDRTDQLEDGLTMCPECSVEVSHRTLEG